jgi:hypothetical protein
MTTQTGNWRGATARVVVTGGSAITAADIVSSGSGYTAGGLLFFDSLYGSWNSTGKWR